MFELFPEKFRFRGDGGWFKIGLRAQLLDIQTAVIYFGNIGSPNQAHFQNPL
jgi:hypothetical protein